MEKYSIEGFKLQATNQKTVFKFKKNYLNADWMKLKSTKE